MKGWDWGGLALLKGWRCRGFCSMFQDILCRCARLLKENIHGEKECVSRTGLGDSTLRHQCVTFLTHSAKQQATEPPCRSVFPILLSVSTQTRNTSVLWFDDSRCLKTYMTEYLHNLIDHNLSEPAVCQREINSSFKFWVLSFYNRQNLYCISAAWFSYQTSLCVIEAFRVELKKYDKDVVTFWGRIKLFFLLLSRKAMFSIQLFDT